jgi:hypothetical protein
LTTKIHGQKAIHL